MQNNSTPSNQPFWVDEPYPYLLVKSANPLMKAISFLFSAISLIFRLIALGLFVFLAFKYSYMWIFVALFGLMVGMRIFLHRYLKPKHANPAAIQVRARDLTGADVIGSAIHTAGHPLLQVNQPVVLALRGDELSLYDYKSATPLDTIRAKDIQSIETIVYDEDRVPHIAVADDTAQAMQITFAFRGSSCKSVFRRLQKVRAIEWYQALQKARLV